MSTPQSLQQDQQDRLREAKEQAELRLNAARWQRLIRYIERVELDVRGVGITIVRGSTEGVREQLERAVDRLVEP